MGPGTAARAVPSPLGVPEVLFGVQRAEVDTDGRCRQTMRTAGWMLEEDGSFCVGSLAVLADDVLGNAVVAGRPAGYWPVTTELSLDVGDQDRRDGSPLYGESWPVHVEPGGGLAQGKILDESGLLVATGTTRLRYAPVPLGFPDDRVDSSSSRDVSACPPVSTADAIGASVQWQDRVLTLVVPGGPWLANPMGNVHGGILLCASEIAGASSLCAEGSPLRTSSLRITYVRPTSATGTITFAAEVQHRGRTLGVAQVVGRDESGRTCTIATITCHDQTLIGS